MAPQLTPRSWAYLWLFLFTVIPLTFDVFLLIAVGRQLAALTYPSVPGVVTHSQTETDWDDDGFSYRPDIRFSYSVNGVDFAGGQYRYSGIASNDSSAFRLVGEYPAGRPVTVYYNPADPADAVLQVGVNGGDLFLALFLLPFNIIMVGSWSLIWIVWRAVKKGGPFAGYRLTRKGSRLAVRLEGGRLLFAVVTARVASVVVVVVVGVFAGVDPPLWVMVGAWGVVIAASVVVYFLNGPPGQGLKMLVLDDDAGTLSLHRRSFRVPDAVVFDSSVTAVAVETLEQHQPDGPPRRTYLTKLRFQDGGTEREEVLIDAEHRDVAEALAEDVRSWLAGRGRDVPSSREPPADF